MDRNILAAEFAAAQERRRRGLTVYGVVCAVVIGLLIVVFWMADPLLGTVALVSFAVVFGLMALVLWMVMSAAKRNAVGPSTPGPVTIGQVYVGRPQAEVWSALTTYLQFMRRSFHQSGPTTLQTGTGASFTSWGANHLIDVRPSADHQGYTVVTALGHPTLPMVLTDYGAAKKTNDELLAAAL